MVGFRRGARNWGRCAGIALVLGAVLVAQAWGVIEALTSLEKFVGDADAILVASVKQLDLEQGRLVLTAESRLKGADGPASLPVKLAGNAKEALAGVNQGDRAVLFISRGPQQDLAYGYAGGAWFLLIGTHDQESVRWQFKSGEPYLRRTYADETSQLIEVLKGNVGGTGGLPVPDATIAPGYGLVSGKHSVLAKVSEKNVALPVTPGGSAPPAKFPLNAPLTIVAAGCTIVLVFMLTRSVPAEAGDV